jgi:type II secretory pathway pseudopilin PulG
MRRLRRADARHVLAAARKRSSVSRSWCVAAETRLSEQRGTTLIELMAALALTALVLGLPSTLYVVALHDQNRTTERGETIQAASTGMDRMVREIRDARSVTIAPSGERIELTTYLATGSGSPVDVVYDCSQGACTRGEASPGQTPSSRGPTVIADVSAIEFSGHATGTAARPGYVVDVDLRVQPPRGPGHPIELSDRVSLRNAST